MKKEKPHYPQLIVGKMANGNISYRDIQAIAFYDVMTQLTPFSTIFHNANWLTKLIWRWRFFCNPIDAIARIMAMHAREFSEQISARARVQNQL